VAAPLSAGRFCSDDFTALFAVTEILIYGGAASKVHGFILQQSRTELICRKSDLAIFLKTAAMRFSTFH
jgi:hypothetical protein